MFMSKPYVMLTKFATVIYFLFVSSSFCSTENGNVETNRLKVAIELFDGSKIIGYSGLTNIPYTADLLGEIDIPVERILYYRKPSPQTNAVIKTVNSDFITGSLCLKEITIFSCLGELKIPVEKITQIVFYRTLTVNSLLDGLVCRWCAEGNTDDLVGGQNGELLFGATYAEGKVGKAFSFNELRSRVHIPDSEKFKFRSSFTIECWVFANKLEEGSGMIICNRSDNRPGKDTFHIGTNNKDFNFYISGEDDYCVVSAPGEEKVWTHLAGMWDKKRKEIRFYINGKLAARKKTDIEPVWELENIPDTGVGIGNHAGRFHVFPFYGKVDELGIYNRALSDDEIRAIYEAGERGEHILPPGILPEK